MRPFEACYLIIKKNKENYYEKKVKPANSNRPSINDIYTEVNPDDTFETSSTVLQLVIHVRTPN